MLRSQHSPVQSEIWRKSSAAYCSRERNNTHLTELGRLIEPHLAEIVVRAGEAKQTAARFIKLEKAQLSLGVMCTIPRCNS